METKNCKICGHIFISSRGNICPECMARDDEDFQTVRSFLKEFPGSKIDIVEKYTNVSRRKILKYLREEKLELAEESADFLKCARCGAPIKKGMYCHNCYKNYTETVKNLFTVPEQNEKSAKMHITINKN